MIRQSAMVGNLVERCEITCTCAFPDHSSRASVYNSHILLKGSTALDLEIGSVGTLVNGIFRLYPNQSTKTYQQLSAGS